jgi:hypothetical protein
MKKWLGAVAGIVALAVAFKRYGNPWWRIKLLITRKSEWVNADTGGPIVEHESWGTAWTIAGPHPWMWWWMKYGKRECGCQINPLTRKQQLVCLEHSGFGDILAKVRERMLTGDTSEWE